MLDVDRYFDDIDSARLRRVRELIELKQELGGGQGKLASVVKSKAVVVLVYAGWEGFYNDCTEIYLDFLTARGGKVRETDWMMMLGACNADFESLRARNHSVEAKREFVANLQARMECGFESFDRNTVRASSNLDFRRVALNYSLLNFELTPLQRYRLRIDKELVAWRHSVAHGDSPDLSALDVSEHVDFTSDLLIVIADCFQYAILERM